MDVVYMNNAATSWPKPESVYRAIDNFNRNIWANPGRGSSSKTIQAGEILINTRESLGKLFNFQDLSRVIFTKNVTEAINTVLKGYLRPGDHVITTGMEHNAVARPLQTLTRQGIEYSIVACSPEGILDPREIEKAWRSNTRMICMLHASNLTGTIMPVGEIGNMARKRGVVFLVDAAQTAGVSPIDVEEMNIDILAFTGHKGLFGPQGTGGFYLKPGIEITPLIEGGTGSLSEAIDQPDFLPDKYESGTLNTPGIAGLGAGVDFILKTGVKKIRQREQELTEMLITGLKKIPGVILYGPGDSIRQTAIVSINAEGLDCGELSFLLEQRFGIISRSGLHCTPLAHRTIGTIKTGACRLSPGFFTRQEDIELVIRAVDQITRLS